MKAKRYDASRAFECPHNEACLCMEKKCFNCGWNPTVAKERKAKLGVKEDKV